MNEEVEPKKIRKFRYTEGSRRLVGAVMAMSRLLIAIDNEVAKEKKTNGITTKEGDFIPYPKEDLQELLLRGDLLKRIFQDEKDVVNDPFVKYHHAEWDQLLVKFEMSEDDITATWFQKFYNLTPTVVQNNPVFKKDPTTFLRMVALEKGYITKSESLVVLPSDDDNSSNNETVSNSYIMLYSAYRRGLEKEVEALQTFVLANHPNRDEHNILRAREWKIITDGLDLAHKYAASTDEDGDDETANNKLKMILGDVNNHTILPGIPIMKSKALRQSDQIWRTLLHECGARHKDNLNEGNITYMFGTFGEALFTLFSGASEKINNEVVHTITLDAKQALLMDTIKELFMMCINAFKHKYHYAVPWSLERQLKDEKLKRLREKEMAEWEALSEEEKKKNIRPGGIDEINNRAQIKHTPQTWFHEPLLVDSSINFCIAWLMVNPFQGGVAQEFYIASKSVIERRLIQLGIVEDKKKQSPNNNNNNNDIVVEDPQPTRTVIDKIVVEKEDSVIFYNELFVNTKLRNDQPYQYMVITRVDSENESHLHIDVKKMDPHSDSIEERLTKKAKTDVNINDVIHHDIIVDNCKIRDVLCEYHCNGDEELVVFLCVKVINSKTQDTQFQCWNVNLNRPKNAPVLLDIPNVTNDLRQDSQPMRKNCRGTGNVTGSDFGKSSRNKEFIVLVNSHNRVPWYDRGMRYVRVLALTGDKNDPYQLNNVAFGVYYDRYKNPIKDSELLACNVFQSGFTDSSSCFYMAYLTKSEEDTDLRLVLLKYVKPLGGTKDITWLNSREAAIIKTGIEYKEATMGELEGFCIVFITETVFYAQFRDENSATYHTPVFKFVGDFISGDGFQCVKYNPVARTTQANIVSRMYKIFERIVFSRNYYMIYQSSNKSIDSLKVNYVFCKHNEETEHTSFIFIKMRDETVASNIVVVPQEVIKPSSIVNVSVTNDANVSTLIVIKTTSGMLKFNFSAIDGDFESMEINSRMAKLTLGSSSQAAVLGSKQHNTKLCDYCHDKARFEEADSGKLFCGDFCQEMDTMYTKLYHY
jgi:hypothetical protein